MTYRISAAARTASLGAHLQSILDSIDAGTGAPTLVVRTGAQPASVADTATGTTVFTFSLNSTAAFSRSGLVGTLVGTPAASAAATVDLTPSTGAQAPGWFRIFDASGTAVVDGQVGTDLTLSDYTVTAGQSYTITACTITQQTS